MADFKKLSHSKIAESISNLEDWSLSGENFTRNTNLMISERPLHL